MIDSHTHLEMCDPPDAELVEAAVEAGVNRIVTIGIDGASCRAALAAAEDFPQVYAAVGRHPNSAAGFDDADLAELAALAAHPKCVAVGETVGIGVGSEPSSFLTTTEPFISIGCVEHTNE